MTNQEIYNSIKNDIENYSEQKCTVELFEIHKRTSSKYNMSYKDVDGIINMVIGDLLRNPLSWTFRRFITGATKYHPVFAKNFNMNVGYYVDGFIRQQNVETFLKWAHDLVIEELIHENIDITEGQIHLVVDMIQKLRPIINSDDLYENMEATFADLIIEDVEGVFLDVMDTDDVSTMYDDMMVLIHNINGAIMNGLFPSGGESNTKDVLSYVRERVEMFVDKTVNSFQVARDFDYVVESILQCVDHDVIEVFTAILDAASEKYDSIFTDTREIYNFIGTIISTIWQLY